MLTQGEKKKFRMSAEWKKFRQRMKKITGSMDWVTRKQLTKTWNLHHLDMRDKNYTDLSDITKFMPLNKDTHEFIHWLYYLYCKDEGILLRIMSVMETMYNNAHGVPRKTNKRVRVPFFLNKVIHKKTGNVYFRFSARATDCTNSRDGTRCIVYYNADNGKFFVREEEEFNEKFDTL